MNKLRSLYMERAKKERFQEIADSPTFRYYTNWKEFEKRLFVKDSTTFTELPTWLRWLSNKRLVITNTVTIEGIESDWVTVYNDYDIIDDIQVTGKIEYLHAARAKAIVELRVPGDEDAGTIVVASLSGDGYTGHHVRVFLEPGSKAEILFVDLGHTSNDSIKTLTVTYEIRDNAYLRQYLLVNDLSTATYSRRIYRLDTGAKLDLSTLYSNGPATRINEDIFLNGRYSEANIIASAIASWNDWGDILLNARHRGANSRAFINGRGVVLENGLLTLRGIAIVEDKAEWSTSHVEVHVSTFGEDARGYASPMLEIHTGNVEEAFHSASVSSIGEEELFYLKSRGLTDSEARELLIEGIVYYSGVIDKMNVPLREILS